MLKKRARRRMRAAPVHAVVEMHRPTEAAMAERERRLAAFLDRSPQQEYLGDPPEEYSALAQRVKV